MDTKVEMNKAICKVFFDELLNQDNLAAVDKFVDSGVEIVNPFLGQRSGSDGIRDINEIYRIAFPDLKANCTELIGEGDQVVVKLQLSGTHGDVFMNIPATGKKLSWEHIAIVKLVGEKIVSYWSMIDHLAILQPMGAVAI
ncbi:ester cyclase [Pedobacter sandarakinus]|uniref:ester cyclase n=1 Tax=Pedobacter sandarakinus TaxID=353156 RepID=UPI002247CA88|nr:ester cyclase [Pedobacter sandarakinus]MCX2573630.1 ester cyclase [Pedobacter sandarakinus]